MLFYLITDYSDKFNNNPLIIESNNNFKLYDNLFYLIDGIEKAIFLNFPVDYLTPKIKDNIWWFDTSPDNIIIDILTEKRKAIKKTIPILNISSLEGNLISYSDDKVVCYFDRENVYLIDKKISNYFGRDIDYQNVLNYENNFRIYIKQMGLVTEYHTLENLKNYLIKLFSDEYWIYILIVFAELYKSPENYLAFYKYKDETKNAWEELFKVEDYLNQVKIYSINSRVIDFNFQKDSEGKFYVQNKYRGSESTTGRIFAYDLDGNQSLQNLSKEKRNVLKAEKDCYLLEVDYKSFEFNILSCLIDEKIETDPHQKIVDLLFDEKVDRSVGKGINYSIIYGKDIEKISKEISEEYNLDYNIIYSKLSNYPFYKKAKEFSLDLIKFNYRKSKKLLRNYFNRWIKIEKSEYVILNNYIQSSGCDFIYLKFNLLVEYLKQFNSKNKILFQNHDSIMFQLTVAPNSEKIFKGIMEIVNEPYRQIEIKADYKYGLNWRDLV